ncbi:MAG: hypothetical protein ACR2RE_15210 [Geminicoccaceae bacterium]
MKGATSTWATAQVVDLDIWCGLVSEDIDEALKRFERCLDNGIATKRRVVDEVVRRRFTGVEADLGNPLELAVNARFEQNVIPFPR